MAATDKRKLRHVRLRKTLAGTSEKPRLSVHFSGRHITAQVIDDLSGKTLVSANTTEADLRAKPGTRAKNKRNKNIYQEDPYVNVTKPSPCAR
jgi:large subunit ribosomal protein L18